MLMRYSLLFATLCGLSYPSFASAVEVDTADEQLLHTVGLRTDGPFLLEFLHKRTSAAVDSQNIQTLVRQLGDASLARREQASADLIAIGPASIPLLRLCVKDADQPQAAERAQRCLQYLTSESGTALTTAAVRLLAKRNPKGTAEALLAFVLFAENEAVIREVQSALGGIAWRNDNPEPALIRALGDDAALRRIVAAEVLVQYGKIRDNRVTELLKDPKPGVRLRVALALAAAHSEESAVATLIGLLDELPTEQAKLAEQSLRDLAAELAPKEMLADDAASRKKCRAAWTEWWANQSGDALLEPFRQRTMSDADRERVAALIRRLGDESFGVREKTILDIVDLGKAAAPLLRQAAHQTDPEISSRAQRCLERIEKESVGEVPSVAVRLVALRRPAGAVEALLAFLPFADDDAVVGEVQSALINLGLREGRPDPALIKALDDKFPLRRIAAADALAHMGAEPRALVRKLLRDPDALVRLRTALALADTGERSAVTVLIALLGELPAEQIWQAEDYLCQLAGADAPKQPTGTEPALRQQYRDAWAEWWRQSGDKIELNRRELGARLLGYTLVIQQDHERSIGRVMELGAGGKIRWQIDGLEYPIDAHILPGNRVLIAEFEENRVTERDFKGKILWQKNTTMSPVNAQRLANGNTFIATRNQLLEVDTAGKEIMTITRASRDVRSATKLRNGQIVLITAIGNCIRMEADGKELKSFSVGTGINMGAVDVQPNGRVLVTSGNRGKVLEFDTDGKLIWEAAVTNATSATRTLDGHTLVACVEGNRVLELSQAGKIVWEYKSPLPPVKVRRR